MLKLTRQIEDGIRKAGAEAYPNECCGILFGSEEDGNHVVKALKAIDNARESGEQYHRFLITAEEMMQLVGPYALKRMGQIVKRKLTGKGEYPSEQE